MLCDPAKVNSYSSVIRKTPTSLPAQRRQCVKKTSCTPLPSAIFVGCVHYRFFTSVLRLPFGCYCCYHRKASCTPLFHRRSAFCTYKCSKNLSPREPRFLCRFRISDDIERSLPLHTNPPHKPPTRIAHTRRRRQTRRRTTTALLLSSYTSHSSTHGDYSHATTTVIIPANAVTCANR